MSSIDLKHLTVEFSQEEEAVRKLFELIEEKSGKKVEYSFERIIDIANPSSILVIANLLQRLVNYGVFKKVIRLEVNDMPVKEYDSVDQIPNIEHDWKNDIDVEVRPEYLRTYYRLTT